MDMANHFKHAFDRVFQRLYKLTQPVAATLDAVVSTIIDESSTCMSFEQSAYTMSIIPQPIDYFSQCSHSSDCRTSKCYDEFAAFEQANATVSNGVDIRQQPFFSRDFVLPIESLLFSFDDIQNKRNRPPFNVQDSEELSPWACAIVCGHKEQAQLIVSSPNPARCVLLAGTFDVRAASNAPATYLVTNVAVAYYCIPTDITQRVQQWSEFLTGDVATLQAQAYEPRVRVKRQATHAEESILAVYSSCVG